MTKRIHIVALSAVFALTGVSAIVAAQQRPNRVSDQQGLMSRLDTHIDADLPRGTELTITSTGQRLSTSRQR
jgi:hypothetical protein